MDPSHNEQVRELFLRALDQSASQREAFVVQAAGDNLRLRDDVLELLAFAGTSTDELLEVEPTVGTDIERFVAALPPRLGDYAIETILGHGGMGVVCRARDTRSSRIVALKVFPPTAGSWQMLARFQREIEALRRLEHPGIARLIDTGAFALEKGSCAYFAMEFVEGTPLRAYLLEANPSIPERIELVATLCDILAHAHARGVVHRDIKPENIRVRADGSPVLLDFGLAQITAPADVGPLVTRTGQLVGTVRYMSPEQARADSASVGPRSDLYSVGVVGFETLTGRLPYALPPDNIPAAIVAINRDKPMRAGELVPSLAGGIEQALARALEKDPALRQASASALARELRSAASGAGEKRALGRIGGRRTSRTAAIVSALAAVTLLVFALARTLRAPSVTGQLRGPTGEAVANAVILVEDPATAKRLVETATDAGGRFELPRLPRNLEVVVRARSGDAFAAARLVALRRGERRTVALALSRLPVGLRGDSLVAWWPGDGDYTDVAGGHSGRTDFAIGFTPGPRGPAFSFDADHPGGIRVPDDAAFRDAPQFSIDAWIQPFQHPHDFGNGLDGIFGKALGCDRNHVTFSLTVSKDASVGSIALWMPDSTGIEICVTGPDAMVPNDGRFHHVAATFDGSEARLYLDARLVCEQSNPNVRSSGLGKPRIGQHPECSSITVAAIDEVRFFSRALSGEEIAAIHAEADQPTSARR